MAPGSEPVIVSLANDSSVFMHQQLLFWPIIVVYGACFLMHHSSTTENYAMDAINAAQVVRDRLKNFDSNNRNVRFIGQERQIQHQHQ